MKNPFIKEETKSFLVEEPMFGTVVRTRTYRSVDKVRVAIACTIGCVVMVSIIATAVMAIMVSPSNTHSATVNTVVEKQLEEVVVPTTVETVHAQYVCDMATSAGSDYQLMTLSNGEAAYTQFPSVYANTIVFEWQMDPVQSVIDAFNEDIQEVGLYVGKNMRIEMPGYVAQEGEFVVPVKFNELDRADSNYSAYIRWEGNFIFGYMAEFAFNNNFFDNMDGWNNYHHIIVLHELGHLFGLDHVDGDSIMSYDGIWDRQGYTESDIAGFQRVFCN